MYDSNIATNFTYFIIYILFVLKIVVLQVLENSIQELYSQGGLQSLERALTAYRGRAMEKEQIIVREEETKLEIQQLTEQLDTLKASEVEMRKKEMRKIAELKVSKKRKTESECRTLT